MSLHGLVICHAVTLCQCGYFQAVCEELAAELTRPTLLVADRASFHQAGSDKRLQLVHLPTACPDLNPVERFFKEVRKELSNRVFTSLSEGYGAVEAVVSRFISRLSGWYNSPCFHISEIRKT